MFGTCFRALGGSDNQLQHPSFHHNRTRPVLPGIRGVPARRCQVWGSPLRVLWGLYNWKLRSWACQKKSLDCWGHTNKLQATRRNYHWRFTLNTRCFRRDAWAVGDGRSLTRERSTLARRTRSFILPSFLPSLQTGSGKRVWEVCYTTWFYLRRRGWSVWSVEVLNRHGFDRTNPTRNNRERTLRWINFINCRFEQTIRANWTLKYVSELEHWSK